MSSPSHDPPAKLPPPGADLTQFSGPRFEKYSLMRDRLRPHFGDPEPVRVIERMRLTTRTHRRNGRELPLFVAFRLIAPELTRLTGVQVTYETLRRWWELAWPDGHPAEVLGRRCLQGDPRSVTASLARVAKMARQVRPLDIDVQAVVVPPQVPPVPAAEFRPPTP